MKTVYLFSSLLLLLMLGFLIKAFPQQKDELYYWSSSKKFVLQTDSLTLIARTKSGTDKENIKQQLETKKGVSKVEQMITTNQLVIHVSKNDAVGAVQRLKAENLSLEDVSYSYSYGNFPLIPTGEILLQPKKSVTIQSLLPIIGTKASVKEATEYNTFVLKVKDVKDVLTLANQIYESGLVDWCHPDFWAEIVRLQNDPLYPDQYYLNNTGQFGGVANIDINAPQAWALSRGLNTVRVAIIDDGVENHEDLNGRVLPGFTPRIPAGNGAPVNITRPDYRTGHGQACAGIVAATQNNSLGVSGVYPCAQIVPVNIFADWFVDVANRTRFRETAVDIAAGINWAWNNGQAAVLSNSWGFGVTTATNANIPNFDAIVQAITNVRTNGRGGRGSIVVFASGNSNQDFAGVTFPANVAGVVTVGAIDRSGNIWNYSSRGPQMDLVAPSGNVNNLGDVRTTDRTGANGYVAGNYVNTFGGTSAACPQVSGAAGLLASINPNLTEVQIVNLLTTTAIDMGASGFDNTFGRGRLNLQSAVQGALNTYTVTNQTLMCGTRTYILSPAPAGVPVSWSVTPANLVTVSSGNGVTANLTRNTAVSGGQATITFTAQGNCGNTTFSRTFQVGPFSGSQIAMSGTTGVCPGNAYNYTANVLGGHVAGYTYSWTYPSGWSVSSQGGNTIRLYVPSNNPQYGAVRVTVNNGCGTGTNGLTVFPNYSCGGYLTNGEFLIYPNPANEQLTIEKPQIVTLNTEVSLFASSTGASRGQLNQPMTAKSNTAEFQVELLNNQQKVVAKATSRNHKIPLDTEVLPPGLYYLQIYQDKTVAREQVVIE